MSSRDLYDSGIRIKMMGWSLIRRQQLQTLINKLLAHFKQLLK